LLGPRSALYKTLKESINKRTKGESFLRKREGDTLIDLKKPQSWLRGDGLGKTVR